MPTRFFESPVRVQELRDGLAGPSLEGFAHDLCRQAMRKQLLVGTSKPRNTSLIGYIGKASRSPL